MKKIDSIHYGGRVIGIGLVLLVLIPAVLLIVGRISHLDVLSLVAYFSMVVGALIEVLFFVFLLIESRQDKKIDAYVQSHKRVKITLPDGKYECGSCGNRNVRGLDTECLACGITFEQDEYRSSQDILDS
jgi:hypothetical protein